VASFHFFSPKGKINNSLTEAMVIDFAQHRPFAIVTLLAKKHITHTVLKFSANKI